MAEAAVQLKVAGQTYRVVTSAAEEELQRLATVVERALSEVTPPGRQPSPQSLVLAAITLAHELEQERARCERLKRDHRAFVVRTLDKIDEVLGDTSRTVRDLNPPAPRRASDAEAATEVPVASRQGPSFPVSLGHGRSE